MNRTDRMELEESALHDIIVKTDGQTPSERYLKQLCDRSFLSLWSYPGVYRDQRAAGKEGKEVCDLLVVFGQHIIIFSDKHCRFPKADHLQLAWSRWFRKTIKKSAEQVWGAERWISKFPSRLFLDRLCTKRFPIRLPDPQNAVFHRVVVAHGMSEHFRALAGGSGSLIIRSDIVGDDHNENPFMIGWVDERPRGYVHVFDDATLDVVMKTLDTVTDFVWYLEKKEQLLASDLRFAAAGEEELLAYYLGHLNSAKRHDFVFPEDYNGIVFGEGLWEKFLVSPERKAQLEADRVSYCWDELIETFLEHVMSGTQYCASPCAVDEQEKIFRYLAREPRTRRRMLARALLERVVNTPPNYKAARVILPSSEGDPHYVFLVLPWHPDISEEDYRRVRRELLVGYCKVVKLEHPDAQHIIGIATEAGVHSQYRSEDALYFDATDWTEKDEQDATALQHDLGLLKHAKVSLGTEQEYPLPSSPARQLRVSRNSQCPCGSGKRHKRCCGKGLAWKSA